MTNNQTIDKYDYYAHRYALMGMTGIIAIIDNTTHEILCYIDD